MKTKHAEPSKPREEHILLRLKLTSDQNQIIQELFDSLLFLLAVTNKLFWGQHGKEKSDIS